VNVLFVCSLLINVWLPRRLYAVCRGVRMKTLDNVAEVQKKCAMTSKKIQLVISVVCQASLVHLLRIGPFYWQRRRHMGWRLPVCPSMLVVDVKMPLETRLHCVIASLRWRRRTMDSILMTILDIGGGFPGETHSLRRWGYCMITIDYSTIAIIHSHNWSWVLLTCNG
jgi:hypothetical protein